MNDNMYINKSGLSPSFVGEHLKGFTEDKGSEYKGGSFLVSKNAYDRFIYNSSFIGFKNDCSNYILRSDVMDDVISSSNGDLREIEKKLGLPENHLKDGPLIRIDVLSPELNNIRMAEGTEIGANYMFNTSLKLRDGDKQSDVFKTIDDEEERLEFQRKFNVRTKRGDRNYSIIKFKSPAMKEKYQDQIKGNYYDYDTGEFHKASLEGYKGRSSGGYQEAVVDCMLNTKDNVLFRVYDKERDGVVKIKANDKGKEIPKTPKTEKEIEGYITKKEKFVKELNSKGIVLDEAEQAKFDLRFKSLYVRTYDSPNGLRKNNHSLMEVYNYQWNKMPTRARSELRQFKDFIDELSLKRTGRNYCDIDGGRVNLASRKKAAAETRSGVSTVPKISAKEKTVTI